MFLIPAISRLLEKASLSLEEVIAGIDSGMPVDLVQI